MNKQAPRAPERYLDNGAYNRRPDDPEYSNFHYQTHDLEKTLCAVCGTLVAKTYMVKHMRTSMCHRNAIADSTTLIECI